MSIQLSAFWQLLRFETNLPHGSFARIHRKVRETPCAERVSSPELTQQISDSIDMACIWYPKRVQCLQRSAATACLLRQHRIPALMIVGAQKTPFKSHAWVEVDGVVVNDKPYMREIYAILDFC